MSKVYAVFNSENVLETTLIEKVHNIPVGAIEITGDQQRKIINETDGVWTLQPDGSITKKPLTVTAPNYPELIANIRYEHEVGGIAVEGVRIETDRDSQALITGATVTAMLDTNYTCIWKTANGPVQLDAAQLIAVASAVRGHVQACFDRECQILSALADGTFTPSMIDEGWPV